MLNNIKDKIMKDIDITKEEAICLINEDTTVLCNIANEIRKEKCGSSFNLCTIINGRSGKCSEDCKYCAQSVYYNTDIEIYDLLCANKILASALSNEKAKVHRFSIVTSGKRMSDTQIDKLCETYKLLKEKCNIGLCASHGLISYENLVKIRKSGVRRYHNNLETSRNFFPSICTTHTYDEKIETILNAKKAGLSVCSGGIFGLGESMEDRIDMAFTLKELDVDSVPINILNPIKGTPLENNPPLSYDEIKKSIAIYRFILPTKEIRLAGGRALMEDKGLSAMKSGINSAISGDMLTTSGITTKEDIQMIKRLGFTLEDE